ncbi:hypothetical protein BZG21_36065, partial [Escherichia coli]|nr:hypothetical protein [Escherichia coli]
MPTLKIWKKMIAFRGEMMFKPRWTKYMVLMLVMILSISNVGMVAAADKELSKIVLSKNELSLE